jgi:hypothetical protein
MEEVYASAYLPPIFAKFAETIIWQIKRAPRHLALGLCVLLEAKLLWRRRRCGSALAVRYAELGVDHRVFAGDLDVHIADRAVHLRDGVVLGLALLLWPSSLPTGQDCDSHGSAAGFPFAGHAAPEDVAIRRRERGMEPVSGARKAPGP